MARGSGAKALVIVLLTLVVVGVAADVVARLVVEGSLSERLRTELRLERAPDVSLKGFPFLLHLARQRFPEATVEARDVTEAGLRVERVTLNVRDLRFSGRGGIVRASEGTGELQVTEDAVTEALADQEIPVTVEFLGPEVRIRPEGIDVAATGRLSVREESLVFEPEEIEPAGIPVPPLTFEIALPQVVEGITFRDVEVRDGVAIVQAELSESILRVRV